MTYNEIIASVAEELGIPRGMADRIYKAYWKTVRRHISALPLKDDLTDEEFQELRPNVNIPAIGKLYVTLERYKKKKESYKEYQKKNAAHQENQADVHDNSDYGEQV